MAKKFRPNPYKKYIKKGGRSAKENNPKLWKELQKKCFTRDGYRCQFRDKDGKRCRYKKLLQMHHIDKKSTVPAAAFLLDNVITLCAKHHKLVTGSEKLYAPLFKKIIASI